MLSVPSDAGDRIPMTDSCPACDELHRKFRQDEGFRNAVMAKYGRCKAIEEEIKSVPSFAAPQLAITWKQEHGEYKRLLEASVPHSHPLGSQVVPPTMTESLERGESHMIMDGVASGQQHKVARAKTPILAAEICILLISCTMAFRNYSGLRTVFAAVSFVVAIQLCVSAQFDIGTENRVVGVSRQQERLRPRLACIYACHWTVDCLELIFGGHTALTAVTIATSMLKGKFELAFLFGSLLAMLAAERSRATRETLSWVMAGQTVLAVRAYVVWRELDQSTDPRSMWRRDGGAAQYAATTLVAQIGWPVLAAALALALTAPAGHTPTRKT